MSDTKLKSTTFYELYKQFNSFSFGKCSITLMKHFIILQLSISPRKRGYKEIQTNTMKILCAFNLQRYTVTITELSLVVGE